MFRPVLSLFSIPLIVFALVISESSKALALPAKEKKPAIREKWALIVSCEKYFDKDIPSISSATDSGVALKETLTNPLVGRFAPAHVASVSGTKTIKSNIEKCVGEPWLLKHALPGDLVLLYFNTRYKTVPGKNDIFLCFYDTPSGKGNLDNTISLRETLKTAAKRTQSPYIICLLDISPAVHLEDGTNPPSKLYDEIAQDTNTTILAATHPGMDAQHAQTKKCSALVDNLTEALKAGAGQTDLIAVSQYIQQNTGTEKAIFAYPRNDSMVVKAILGMPTKSSTPEHIRIGHNPDTVYIEERQAALAQKAAPTASAQEKDEDDDDDENNANNKDASALDFGSYMKKMKKDIQSKWVPPKGFNAERVVAVFTITKDGRIVEPQIVESSGKDNIDQLALQALNQASPLDPLPKGSPSSVQIRYLFDWNVH